MIINFYEPQNVYRLHTNKKKMSKFYLKYYSKYVERYIKKY